MTLENLLLGTMARAKESGRSYLEQLKEDLIEELKGDSDKVRSQPILITPLGMPFFNPPSPSGYNGPIS